MKRKWLVPALLCAIPFTGAMAQNKIATLNSRVAIAGTNEGKKAQADIESKFAPRRAELEAMQKQVDALQQKLTTGNPTDEQKAKIQRDGALLAKRLQNATDQFNDEVQAAQGDAIDTIGRKLANVVADYAKANGYTVVLDTSVQGSPIVYSSIDITQEIVTLYDKANPASRQ